MSTPRPVEAFYERIWNRGELAAAHELLTEDFRFRGSLGEEMRGVDPFLDYARRVREALADYHCQVLDCVTEGDRAFAKMFFSGRHVAPFRGYTPTGERVGWHGAVFFRIAGGRIAELWALGDLAGLDRVLAENASRGTPG